MLESLNKTSFFRLWFYGLVATWVVSATADGVVRIVDSARGCPKPDGWDKLAEALLDAKKPEALPAKAKA